MLKLDPAVLKMSASQLAKQNKRKNTVTAKRVLFWKGKRKKGWALVKALLPQIVDYGRREGLLQAPELSESNNFHIRLMELAQQQQRAGRSEDDDPIKGSDDGLIRKAIPYMPVKVAVFCFVLNMLCPGLGTVAIAFFILACVGEVRLHMKEGKRMMAAVVNVLVGCAQFLTVTFFLVGWFWSIAWGGLFVVYALHYKRMQKQRRAEVLAIAAVETFTKNSLLHRSKMKDIIKQQMTPSSSHATGTSMMEG